MHWRSGLLALIVLSCRTREAPREEPAPIDTRSPQRRRLEETLAKTPCDRPATMELLGLLLDADTSKAVEWAGSYLATCGEDEHVRRTKLNAHQRLRQWDSALLEANALVTLLPRDPAPLVLRAEVYVALGQDEDAASDLRDALGLDPAAHDAPLRLADVYDRQGRACDSAKMLTRAIAEHPSAEARQPLEARLASYDRPCGAKGVRVAKGRRARPAGTTVSAGPTMPVNLTPQGPAAPDSTPRMVEGNSEKAIIHFTPGRTAQTSVLLNGSVRVTMIVDTGASSVAIPRRIATKLGLDVEKLRPTKVATAGGERPAWVGTLAEVRVGNLSAREVRCLIGEDRDMGMDGLLGQSFLGRFKTTLDAARGEIEISAQR